MRAPLAALTASSASMKFSSLVVCFLADCDDLIPAITSFVVSRSLYGRIFAPYPDDLRTRAVVSRGSCIPRGRTGRAPNGANYPRSVSVAEYLIPRASSIVPSVDMQNSSVSYCNVDENPARAN